MQAFIDKFAIKFGSNDEHAGLNDNVEVDKEYLTITNK